MEVNEGTILVVEDHEQIRELLKITLVFQGYKVYTATNGVEALAKIEKCDPALIITDLLMPKMDGYAMIYRLRQNKATREIPVIVLSATYVSVEDKEFAFSLGALRFMEKPIDTAEFLLMVEESLSEGRDAHETPLDDHTFLSGYKFRLEDKLQQKTKQLLRMERLLKTLPDTQKSAYFPLLDEAREHKQEIQIELNDINTHLADLPQEFS